MIKRMINTVFILFICYLSFCYFTKPTKQEIQTNQKENVPPKGLMIIGLCIIAPIVYSGTKQIKPTKTNKEDETVFRIVK